MSACVECSGSLATSRAFIFRFNCESVCFEWNMQQEEHDFEKFQLFFYMRMHAYVHMRIVNEDLGFGHLCASKKVTVSDNSAILQ